MACYRHAVKGQSTLARYTCASPNNALQLTASSLRYAPASGSS
jgi:hypothetical protein